MTQGPQGKPIAPVSSGYGFIPSSPAEAEPAPAPANDPAPAPAKGNQESRVVLIDTPQYAEAISECIQAHPDLNEVMAKFLSIAQALQGGHDVRDVVYALAQTCAQFAGVASVKQQQVGSGSDGEAALDALGEIGDIAEELRKGIEKVILPKAQKDNLLSMVTEILSIVDDFSDDDEDEVEE